MSSVAAPLPQPPASPLPGVNVLLIGPPGSGKTDSLTTLAEAGLETFVIFTEPHGRSVLQAAAMRRKLDLSRLHYAYVPPQSGSWADMMERSDKITRLSWSMLSGQTEDPQKGIYRGFYNLLSLLHNFRCEHCQKEFGDVSSWRTDRAICVDSLSGINEMAMQMVSGASIAKSQPQWGAAMNSEMMLANKLCYDTRAFFVLVAHLERQIDEVMGGNRLVPLALGRKVAPDLPRYFNDVILTVREGDKFLWNTAATNADVKATTCAISEKLPPSFVPLIEEWKRRGGVFEGEIK